jgi:hypothetical protein|tara:strand:+ start:701 stop:1171 length:471 start_codon:yes stop_codon:yes gene_type:complete
MKKVSLDTWIQLLGMLGLLGGLVFVGLELQQSQRIAVATQIQGRNQMMSNSLLAPLEGQLTAVSLRQTRPHEELSETELLIREQIVLHRSLTITNAWQQYSLGLLTDDAWNVPAERARTMYNYCPERKWVTASFTPSLVEYAENNWASNRCTARDE